MPEAQRLSEWEYIEPEDEVICGGCGDAVEVAYRHRSSGEVLCPRCRQEYEEE